MNIREQLFEIADEEYRLFNTGLIPNVTKTIGVRVPHLRQIAKEIAKGDWRNHLMTAEDEYYEETMIQGMVIGYATCDATEKMQWIDWFVPKINNWAICDSFCTGLKFTKQNRLEVWDFLQKHVHADEEYAIRFAVVMMLTYFIDGEYLHRVLDLLDEIDHDAYYVKMAVAWAVSICYIKEPEATMPFLETNTLDTFTYNKALSKITDSFRVTPEMKAVIKTMRRK